MRAWDVQGSRDTDPRYILAARVHHNVGALTPFRINVRSVAGISYEAQ